MTLELSIVSLVLGLLIGVGFGMIGALRPGKLGDDVGQGVAVVGLGVPSFVLGTALVTFLSSHFHYFPSSEALREPLRATPGSTSSRSSSRRSCSASGSARRSCGRRGRRCSR